MRDRRCAPAESFRRRTMQAFVPLLTIHRSQIYSDMGLEEFQKNLTVFNEEPIR